MLSAKLGDPRQIDLRSIPLVDRTDLLGLWLAVGKELDELLEVAFNPAGEMISSMLASSSPAFQTACHWRRA
jgi:hypothetical protein